MFAKSLHRYLGLGLCLILLVISITGVMLLWKKEYLWFSLKGAQELVTPSLLPSAIDNIESHYAVNEVVFIQFYSEDLSIHKVFLSDRRYAWHNQQGELIKQWSSKQGVFNQPFEDFILDLHHRFLLGNTIGLNIAGFGGLISLLAIALGLFIWWPRKRLLGKGLLPKNLERPRLLISHGNIGAVFAAPIVLLIITGVILVYPIESRWLLLESLGFSQETVRTEETVELSQHDSGGQLDAQALPSWAQMISVAKQRFPNSRVRSAQPAKLIAELDSPSLSPAGDNPPQNNVKRSINLQQAEGWHRLGRTAMNFFAGGRLQISDELNQPLAKRVFGFSYPLHTSKLGLFYKLFLSLVGFALATICVFGLLSYLKRNA